MTTKNTKARIASGFYQVIERLGGMSDTLAIAGSYGDTLTDDQVADELEAWLAANPALTPPAEPVSRPAAPDADMDWQSVAMWMGFAASVIKSGESWSEQCQQHYDEACAAFDRLAALQPGGER